MLDWRKINIKAIALGALTDWVGSIVGGVAIGIVVGIVLAINRIPVDQASDYMQSALFVGAGLVIGFGFTFLGGFVAGCVAKQLEMLHGGIVGGLGLLLSVIFSKGAPLWFNVISFVLIVPIAAYGGYVAKLKAGIQGVSTSE